MQQERRAYDLAELLQGQREAIARALTAEAGQHGGGRELAALNGEGKLDELRIVFADQIPVDGAAEQRIDGTILSLAVWPIKPPGG